MAAAATALSILGTIWGVFKWTWWILLIIFMFVMKKRYERWPIDAVIIEKRGDNLVKTNDRIGRMYDKDLGLTFYKLLKIGDTIPVYNFDWIMHNADKPTNIFEKIVGFLRPNMGTAFLFRYGSKQYKPINISQKLDAEGNPLKMQLTEIKGKDGEPLFVWNYAQHDPRWVLGVLDFEVVDWDNMNFMVQEHRSSALRRAKKGDWWKNFGISAMIIAVTALVSLLILKFSADAGADLRHLSGGGAPAPEPSGGIIAGAINNGLAPGS